MYFLKNKLPRALLAGNERPDIEINKTRSWVTLKVELSSKSAPCRACSSNPTANECKSAFDFMVLEKKTWFLCYQPGKTL